MGMLDTLIYGYRTILALGVEKTRRNKLNFGSGFSVTDDEENGRTNVTFDGGGVEVPGTSGQFVTANGDGTFGTSLSQVSLSSQVFGTLPGASVQASSASNAGSMSASDKAKLDGLAPLSGWTTVLDVDFSAQAGQTIGTDGTHTIAGRTWTKFNSANDNVAMAIVNGSGLVIQPKSATDYNGATRTFPGIYLPISSFFSTLSLADRRALRITMYIGAQNIGANYDAIVFGIDSQNNTAGYLTKYGRVSSTTGQTVFMQALGSNVGFTDFGPLTLGSSNNVQRLIIPNFGFPSMGIHYAASSGLTDQSFLAGGNISYGTKVDMAGLTPANASLVIGAQRANSATALSVTISRIIVEHK